MKATYRVLTLDVWGNAKDGYDINCKYATKYTIDLEDNASDIEILTALRDQTLLHYRRNNHLTVEGEMDGTLYIDYRGVPLLELRREEVI